MSESTIEQAKREIDESLVLSAFCMRRIGLSFQDPKSGSAYLRQKLMLIASVCGICYHVFSEIVFIGLTLANSPRVEDVVPLFHTFGYGALSIAKVFVLWYKKDVFRQLLNELAGIWPMPPLEEEAQLIKSKSLAALRITHRWYFFMNVSGVWFYNLTPIVIYLFGLIQDKDDKIGYVWSSWYPFDKHQTFAHVAVYLFEIFAGQTCVWIMVSTDLLFSAMASHISILLRLLKRRLESVGTADNEHYQEILGDIKLHQRLITYCNDLENAFSLSNFVNIMLSSVNICCVVFVIVLLKSVSSILQCTLARHRLQKLLSFIIEYLHNYHKPKTNEKKNHQNPLRKAGAKLLEPLMAISNKLFLGSALIQIGMLCWYADDIFHANADVAAAAYNSGWYRTNPRCRRALLFLIQRAQKPIAFTAMGFTNITLVTYSAILTRSYSYFALLYTMYSEN